MRGDLEKEQQYPNERHLIDEGMRSHCIVPLIVRGKMHRDSSMLRVKRSSGIPKVDAQFLQEVAKPSGAGDRKYEVL